jgi:cysteine sulfinate desulfinase/cysteine desulfurase-like protein
MIELAYNINAFFDESRENAGVRELSSQLRRLKDTPHFAAVTPDLFYFLGDLFPKSEIRPLPLDADGVVDLSALPNSVDERTRLVVMSTANIETGILTPADELLQKIRGVSAAEIVVIESEPKFSREREAEETRDAIETEILRIFPFARLNGTSDADRRLPNVSNISFENMNGESIANLLRVRGFSAATGCACADARMRPSMTLSQMNIPYSRAIGSMHFSFGDEFRKPEADKFIKAVSEVIEQVRTFSL